MPDEKVIRGHKHLQCFGTLLHDPNIWHLNRRSVAGAFSVGLFMAFVPVPFQMLLAAGTAIPLRVNLPISVGLVWITNPLTVAPMFYYAHKVGAWLLQAPAKALDFELSIDWLGSGFLAVWQPLLLGCFVLGVGGAAIGNIVVRLFWRMHIIKHLKNRRLRRRQPQR